LFNVSSKQSAEMANNKYNFDITVTGDSYAGELALPYVTAAVKSGDTLAKGYVDQMDGFNDKAVVKNLGYSDVLQAGGCNFSDGEDLTLTERVLTLTDLRVQEEICRGTIYPTWLASNNKMQRNGDLPVDFQEFLLASLAAKAAEEMENAIWQGSTNFGTGFLGADGAATTEADLNAGILANSGSGFTEVDFGTDATSAANVLTHLNAVYNSVVANKAGLLSKAGFGFYMNHQTHGFYMQALAAGGTNQGQNGGFGYSAGVMVNSFMGLPIYVCPGMPNDVVVATYIENLKFGSNLQTDLTEVRVIPVYQYDGSDNVRVSMRFAAGVQAAVITDGFTGSSLWT